MNFPPCLHHPRIPYGYYLTVTRWLLQPQTSHLHLLPHARQEKGGGPKELSLLARLLAFPRRRLCKSPGPNWFTTPDLAARKDGKV